MKFVILSGGEGSRLFPLSRESYPKQFINILDNKSLFQMTVERLIGQGEIYIATNEKYKFIVKNQLKDIKYTLILEPNERKDTGPAVGNIVKYFYQQNITNEPIAVIPSDHYIINHDKLIKYIKNAGDKPGINVFGIKPTEPHTGYGYIEVDVNTNKVIKFHEKPTLKEAVKYIEKGNFYWNSGIFVFKINEIIEEYKLHAPEIYSYIIGDIKYEDLPKISFDYAVMEKTKNAYLTPIDDDVKIQDLGTYKSIYELLNKDENNNAVKGDIIYKNYSSSNNLIISEEKDKLIITDNLDNLMVINTDDVLLIAPINKSSEIKKIYNDVINNPKTSKYGKYKNIVYRPQGYYIDLDYGEGFRVKRIVVNPGEALSLQMHYHRSEHQVIVKGTAKVILSSNEQFEEKLLTENESIFIPKTAIHRIINPGKIPLEIIEVQVGNYVEEDDIERLEDIYNRG